MSDLITIEYCYCCFLFRFVFVQSLSVLETCMHQISAGDVVQSYILFFEFVSSWA